jgi:two-component system C4-dicarboxylate transport response regulator DctD
MGCETTSNVSTKSLVPTREILLVDDDAGLLEVFPQTIEYHLAQVRVTACDSAEAALRHIHSGHYDLVITDLNMPGMKGLEFTRRVKALCPETAVLIITAHGDEEVQREAVRAGADGFIRKPFDRNQVTVSVEEALQRSSRPR